MTKLKYIAVALALGAAFITTSAIAGDHGSAGQKSSPTFVAKASFTDPNPGAHMLTDQALKTADVAISDPFPGGAADPFETAFQVINKGEPATSNRCKWTDDNQVAANPANSDDIGGGSMKQAIDIAMTSATGVAPATDYGAVSDEQAAADQTDFRLDAIVS